MTSDSAWRGWLTSSALRDHEAWWQRGRTGTGRLVLADANLRGVRVTSLRGARLERCSLAEARMPISLLDAIELIDCDLERAALPGSPLKRSRLERCRFVEANLVRCDFDDARITSGVWARANLENTRWLDARVTDVDFTSVRMPMATLDGALFEGCNFQGASIVRGDPTFDLGTAYGTRFVRCDLRGANLEGLRERDTSYEDCLR